VVVIMIGTNDLGAARNGLSDEDGAEGILPAVPAVARAVLQMVHTIQAAAPTAQVLLLALLPRGDSRTGFALPSVFSPALEEVNLHFEHMASQDGRVHYLDCGAVFLSEGGSAIVEERMPDALHPSGPGAQELALCINPEVDRLMALD
jgi:lysophospholipase L1-like esterase